MQENAADQPAERRRHQPPKLSVIVPSIPLRRDDFAVEVEITAKIASRRARVVEVPISYHGRTYREGKKITWRDGIRALVAIVRFRFGGD